MTKKNIITFISTEYHLLLFVNRIIDERESEIENNHSLFIRGKDKFRVSKNLDLSNLNIKVQYISSEFENNKPICENSRIVLKKFLKMKPDEFVFYQEMDLLALILIKQWKKSHETKIVLYQDGSKPYFTLKFNSLGLMKYHHQTNIWLKKNGFSIDSLLSPLWSHRYAFSKEIDEVFLTFPESYINWNNKRVKKIVFPNLERLKTQLEVIFNWNNDLLSVTKNVIFYMNQPMSNKSSAEIEFLEEIVTKYPTNQLYIKLHPLTSENKIKEYSKISNLKIISSTIPAELFIMHLQKSIILSVNSTSMFIDKKDCNFFYLSDIFNKDLKKLRRYNTQAHLSTHILKAKSISDIEF